jgi:general secretion pathway protein G
MTTAMSSPRRRGSSQQGFTILEIVIVFILLAGIMAFIGPKIFQQKDRAEAAAAKIQLQSLAGQIGVYQTDTKRYPQSLQDLVKQPAGVENWNGPYAKPAELKDAWGNDYVYAFPGTEGRRFDLVSYGADGKPGGEGADRDLSN